MRAGMLRGFTVPRWSDTGINLRAVRDFDSDEHGDFGETVEASLKRQSGLPQEGKAAVVLHRPLALSAAPAPERRPDAVLEPEAVDRR